VAAIVHGEGALRHDPPGRLAGTAQDPTTRRPMARRPEENLRMIASVLVALVALLHFYFLLLEMFLWDKPAGLKAFRNTPEKAAMTKVLAANQGLYNGFLGAGLLWGLSLGAAGAHVLAFFLICVVVAGAYGAFSVSRKIFFVQALPALLALAALYAGL
jgi:putative membrane protein